MALQTGSAGHHSVEEGFPALPAPDKQQSSWRPTRALLVFLTSALLGVAALAAVASSSIRDSVPLVRPVRIALDASNKVESLTALVDAEVSHSANGLHSVRLKGGFCAIEAECGLGSRCTVATVRIDEPFYPEASRLHLTARAEQAWPQNLNKAFRSRGRALTAACDLEASVDLFKSGWEFGHTSRWHFEDLGAFADQTAFQIHHQNWAVGKEMDSGKNISAHANFVAEWTLPVGPLVEALETVSLGVHADVGYAESTKRAIESRLRVDDDVSITRNETTGRATISVPFHMEGRVDVHSLAKFLPAAALKLAPSTDVGDLRVSKSQHAFQFQATTDGRAAAQLLGQSHTLGWHRETRMSRTTGGSQSRSLALAENDAVEEVPSRARRLIDIFGIKEFATSHRIYMDDTEDPNNLMIGADIMFTEGPPFMFKLGAVLNDVIDDAVTLAANITLKMDEVKDNAEVDVLVQHLEKGKVVGESTFSMDHDLNAETFDVAFGLNFEEDDEGETKKNTVGLTFGVDVKQVLAHVKGNINDDMSVALSGDFDDLIFSAGVNFGDTVNLNFTGKEDKVELVAALDEVLGEKLEVTLGYTRTDTAEDVEVFAGSLEIEQLTNLAETDLTPTWKADKQLSSAKMMAGASITVDHGRRRSPTSKRMTISGDMHAMGECLAVGEGVPTSNNTMCDNTKEKSTKSCCDDTLHSAVMSMMDMEFGSRMDEEGLMITVDNLDGSVDDFDFNALMDPSDKDAPTATGSYRVANKVHTVTVNANVEGVVNAIINWEEIDGGYKTGAALSDDKGDLNITAKGEFYETQAGEKDTWTAKGSIHDGEGLVGGLSSSFYVEGNEYKLEHSMYDKTKEMQKVTAEVGDMYTRGEVKEEDKRLVYWNLYVNEDDDFEIGAEVYADDKDLVFAKGAYKEATGKWTSEIHVDGESLGNLDFLLDEKTNGDVDLDVTFTADGKRVAVIDTFFDAADGEAWGGKLDLKVNLDIDNETTDIVGSVTLSEAEKVRTIVATGSVNKDDIGVATLTGSEGDADTPMTGTAKFEGVGDDAMKMNMDFEASHPNVFSPGTDRVIVMTKPIFGKVNFNMGEGEDAESFAAMWNVNKTDKGSGNLVAGSFKLDSAKENLVTLGMDFDTSVSKAMVISGKVSGGEEEYATLSGSLPYADDYMAGDLTVKIDDHTQVIATRISRGFLVEETVPEGVYDRMWLNFATDFDVDNSTMKIDLGNLFFERGPMLTWSGTGWSFRLSEMEGKAYKDIYYHSFNLGFDDFETTTTIVVSMPPVKVNEETGEASIEVVMATDVEAVKEMSVADVMDFVSSTTGLEATEIKEEDLSFEIKAVYAFDASVPKEKATEAVAKANGVEPSQVTLVEKTATRRLSADAARRLAAVEYDTIITVPDLEKAKVVMESASDEGKLVEALKEVDPELPPPQVTEKPEVKVVVKVDPKLAENPQGVTSDAPRFAALATSTHLASSLLCGAAIAAAALPGGRWAL